MADNISVSPELLKARAKEVRNLRGEYDETIRRLRNIVNALNEVWVGEAQTAFVQMFEEAQPTFTKFSNGLEQYAATMDATVAEMVSTDQARASKNRAALEGMFH